MVSGEQLDAARLNILRRRVRVLWAVLGAAVIVLAVFSVLVAVLVQQRSLRRPEAVACGVNIALGVWLIVAPRVRRARFAAMGLGAIIRRATMIVVVSVFIQALAGAILAASLTEVLRRWGVLADTGSVGPVFPLLCYLAVVHTAVSAIVPWSVFEAVRPILIMFVAMLVATLAVFHGDSAGMALVGLGLTLAAGVPGTFIAWLRFSRLRDWVHIGFLTRKQEEIERELSVARRIHERLFPAPGDYRGVEVAFAYEPMRQIGGDYLHCHADADGGVLIVVIDVTGHGIGSALAVNRLHGEIKRSIAQGRTDPARLLRALNEYIGDSLADETVFATALAVRIAPDRGSIAWCNAGHPPAMLVRAGGRVERLETTAMMLGATAWEEESASEVLPWCAGDGLVIYTDGVVESVDGRGGQFGIDGVERVLSAAGAGDPGAMVEALHAAVRAYRVGPPQDDSLTVGVRVPGEGRGAEADGGRPGAVGRPSVPIPSAP